MYSSKSNKQKRDEEESKKSRYSFLIETLPEENLDYTWGNDNRLYITYKDKYGEKIQVVQLDGNNTSGQYVDDRNLIYVDKTIDDSETRYRKFDIWNILKYKSQQKISRTEIVKDDDDDMKPNNDAITQNLELNKPFLRTVKFNGDNKDKLDLVRDLLFAYTIPKEYEFEIKNNNDIKNYRKYVGHFLRDCDDRNKKIILSRLRGIRDLQSDIKFGKQTLGYIFDSFLTEKDMISISEQLGNEKPEYKKLFDECISKFIDFPKKNRNISPNQTQGLNVPQSSKFDNINKYPGNIYNKNYGNKYPPNNIDFGENEYLPYYPSGSYRVIGEAYKKKKNPIKQYFPDLSEFGTEDINKAKKYTDDVMKKLEKGDLIDNEPIKFFRDPQEDEDVKRKWNAATWECLQRILEAELIGRTKSKKPVDNFKPNKGNFYENRYLKDGDTTTQRVIRDLLEQIKGLENQKNKSNNKLFGKNPNNNLNIEKNSIEINSKPNNLNETNNNNDEKEDKSKKEPTKKTIKKTVTKKIKKKIDNNKDSDVNKENLNLPDNLLSANPQLLLKIIKILNGNNNKLFDELKKKDKEIDNLIDELRNRDKDEIDFYRGMISALIRANEYNEGRDPTIGGNAKNPIELFLEGKGNKDKLSNIIGQGKNPEKILKKLTEIMIRLTNALDENEKNKSKEKPNKKHRKLKNKQEDKSQKAQDMEQIKLPNLDFLENKYVFPNKALNEFLDDKNNGKYCTLIKNAPLIKKYFEDDETKIHFFKILAKAERDRRNNEAEGKHYYDYLKGDTKNFILEKFNNEGNSGDFRGNINGRFWELGNLSKEINSNELDKDKDKDKDNKINNNDQEKIQHPQNVTNNYYNNYYYGDNNNGDNNNKNGNNSDNNNKDGNLNNSNNGNSNNEYNNEEFNNNSNDKDKLNKKKKKKNTKPKSKTNDNNTKDLNENKINNNPKIDNNANNKKVDDENINKNKYSNLKAEKAVNIEVIDDKNNNKNEMDEKQINPEELYNDSNENNPYQQNNKDFNDNNNEREDKNNPNGDNEQEFDEENLNNKEKNDKNDPDDKERLDEGDSLFIKEKERNDNLSKDAKDIDLFNLMRKPVTAVNFTKDDNEDDDETKKIITDAIRDNTEQLFNDKEAQDCLNFLSAYFDFKINKEDVNVLTFLNKFEELVSGSSSNLQRYTDGLRDNLNAIKKRMIDPNNDKTDKEKENILKGVTILENYIQKVHDLVKEGKQDLIAEDMKGKVASELLNSNLLKDEQYKNYRNVLNSHLATKQQENENKNKQKNFQHLLNKKGYDINDDKNTNYTSVGEEYEKYEEQEKEKEENINKMKNKINGMINENKRIDDAFSDIEDNDKDKDKDKDKDDDTESLYSDLYSEL